MKLQLMDMTKFFIIEEDTSFKITLNRPHIGNAFHHEMIIELTEIFKKINSTSSTSKIKTIFISGSGKHFCTGADLEWMKSAALISETENLSQMEDLISMYRTIAACPFPIIAFVHGCAYGGGIGISSLSDYVISDPSSVFCLSELKYGLIPGALTPFLISKIGRTNFMQLALEPRPFNSEKAVELGLVTSIGTREEALKKMSEINELPTHALRNLKKSVQIFTDKYESGFEKLKSLSAECRTDKEGQERLKAFLVKK